VTDRSEKPSYSERPSRPTQTQSDRVASDIQDYQRNLSEQSQRTSQQTDYQDRDLESKNEQSHQVTYTDEYLSEYYDEPLEDPSPSPPPPRTAVRIVKRPFLPSRGGNPNPRGLSPVGSKAPHSSRREEETTTDHQSAVDENEHKTYYVQEEQEDDRNINHQESHLKSDNKQYDAYKSIQSDLQKKQQQDEYDSAIYRPVLRRPVEKHNEKEEEEEVSGTPEDPSNFSKGYSTQNQSYDLRNHQDESLTSKWTEDYSSDKYANAGNVQTSSPIRSKVRAETTPNIYSSTYKNEDMPDHLPSGPGNNYRVKQRINEVTHRLQDIPESEYDVTLNDALTPTLIQETNLPSGFVLPIHRQHLGRDAVLQPSENNYKLSRPINHHHQQQQQQQQQQHSHQQKSFVPSPSFLPTNNNNDRARTTYYRTPEAIQVSGAQYRQQRQWQDYTVY